MRLIIPGNPIAKARPKFCVRGRHAMAYDPQDKIKTFDKIALKYILAQELGDNDADGDCFKASFSDQKKVTLAFHVPIAISDSIAERAQKLWGILWASKKDLDNYIKYILDIGNGILWHDDSQIVELHATQKYSENPCTIIEIEDIKNTMNDEAQKMMRIFSPAALDKLESDVSVLRAELEGVRLCNLENRTANFETAAGTLKAFASTYCESLKKMTKAVK